MSNRGDTISPHYATKLETLRWRLGLSYRSQFKRSLLVKQFYQKLRWSPLPKRVIGAARRRVLDSGWRAT